MITKARFAERLKKELLLFDGAMGTQLAARDLRPSDFGEWPGCNDALCLTAAEHVEAVHRDYLEAGCHVIETNSFGATRIGMAEGGPADRAVEVNRAAAAIARRAADAHSTEECPRWVAGSIGPTSKLPGLGQIAFRDMEDAYAEQVQGLVEGGVDFLLVETCQDLLQVRAAVWAARRVFAETGNPCPIVVTMSVQPDGQTLLGAEPSALLAVLESLDLDGLGLNCSTGPEEMLPVLSFLGRETVLPLLCQPNAGLPTTVNGELRWSLEADALAGWARRFVSEHGVTAMGGCCGTGPVHLKAMAEALKGMTPAPRPSLRRAWAAGPFAALDFHQEPAPLFVAEELNSTTRAKRFRNLIEGEAWEEAVSWAAELSSAGSHALDLCVACRGRDEQADLGQLLEGLRSRVGAALFIDSTSSETIVEAARRHPGKHVLNSIHLEGGEEAYRKALSHVRKAGAAVVALCIDEEGMARSLERKLAVARRLVAGARGVGLPMEDLLLDPLTFPLATGDDGDRRGAVEALAAFEAFAREFPRCPTVAGVSNVSFGLPRRARRVLNTVYLDECLKRGLAVAIVSYGKLLPMDAMSPEEVERARDLIHDRGDGALDAFLALFTSRDEEERRVERPRDPAEALRHAVCFGLGGAVEESLGALLKDRSALNVLNDILLPSMNEVGKRFQAGRLPLPGVLQAAAVMKRAMDGLDEALRGEGAPSRGRVLLATVRGDVHDIGKNLVAMVCAGHGFEVVDLGVKQSATAIVDGVRAHDPDFIGLSGLLLQSVDEMGLVLDRLEGAGMKIPVLVGGAALRPDMVRAELAPRYSGPLRYAGDAVEGVEIMVALASEPSLPSGAAPSGAATKPSKAASQAVVGGAKPSEPGRGVASSWPELADPRPPDEELCVWDDFSTAEILSEVSLSSMRALLPEGRRGRAEEAALHEELAKELLASRCIEAMAVRRHARARRKGESLVLLDSRGKEAGSIATPPQSGRALCDAYPEDGPGGLLPVFVCTLGGLVGDYLEEVKDRGDFGRYAELHHVLARAADGLARKVHRRLEGELDLRAAEGKAHARRRYSLGYPACPSLSAQRALFRLLDPENRIGVRLSDSFQMEPVYSVSAFIVLRDPL